MNPRLLGRIGVLVSILTWASFAPAEATDSFEPNDDPNQAHPLSSGVAVESWVSTAQDVDWYRFAHTDPNATVDILMTSLPDDYDLEIYVLNTQTQQLDFVAVSENPETTDEHLTGTLAAGDYFIHIYGFDGRFDASDSYFLTATFAGGGGNTPPQVTVLSPNGGETVVVGTTPTITYTATDAESPGALTIAIEYSTNGGTSWNIVTSSTSNNGSFPWTVPNTPTTQGRVRVSASDGQLLGQDVSDGNFTIQQAQGSQPPVVTVSSPNGGESLTGGSTHAITYSATDPDTDDASLVITLEFSTNGGTSWTQLAGNQANTGSFGWTVPSSATTQGRIRVTANDGTQNGSDTSNGNFTITTAPQGSNTLAVTNGTGESGTTITVQLTLNNENSVKALQTDLVFDPAVLSFTSFAASGRAAAFADSSNAISSGRVRVVLYSMTSASLNAGTGTIAQIVFQAIGAGGSSSAVTPSTSVLSDSNGQALSVTAVAGNIAVTGGGGSQPTVTVVAPNGGESFVAGSIRNVTYAASGGTGALSIDVAYSTNGGTSFVPVQGSLNNTGTFAWSVPNTTTTQGRVRVTATDSQTSASDTSDGNFSITSAPSGNVLAIGSGSGESGTSVSVPVQLSNDVAVKALQFDLSFDPSAASFLSATASDRGAGLADSAAVVGTGLARVLLFARGTETISPGTGTVANLNFQLRGAAGQSQLSPSNAVLSDPSGAALTVTVQAGVLTVTGGGGGGESPIVDIAVLKNPGRTRSLQIFVSVDQGSGGAPSLTVGGSSVALSPVSAGLFQATVAVAQSRANVAIVASDTNSEGTGTDQVTVSF